MSEISRRRLIAGAVSTGAAAALLDSGYCPARSPDLGDLATAVPALDRMSRSVSVDAPWKAANAAIWDGMTLQTFVDSHNPTRRFEEVVAASTAGDLRRRAARAVAAVRAFYTAASGNERHPGTFERTLNTHGGAQMWRFHGGSQEIALRIARQLGDRVILRSPVRRIVQGRGVATV